MMEAITKNKLRKAACFFILLMSLSVYSYAQPIRIKVIELRNYLLRPGTRENYINAFESLLLDTLNARKNYVLGQYRVNEEKDHFVWIRGFDDMPLRKYALESFFGSQHWAKVQSEPGKYLIGYTNVYLLKPLSFSKGVIDSISTFDANWFGRDKGVTVVDFYVANGMRDQLLDFVRIKYDSLIHAAGVKDISYWISETTPNNFPDLPVFQDKNLLATISFFKDELAYNAALRKIDASLNDELKFTMGRIVTTKNTWILYPTKKSFSTSDTSYAVSSRILVENLE
jgi:hypothetical protein